MARAPLGKHGRDHRLGGHDPIPGLFELPTGTPLPALIETIGDCVAWWRCGNTFTFPADVGDGGTYTVSAAFPDSIVAGGTHRDLDYEEKQLTGTWSTSNRPTLDQVNDALGSADDGAVQFTYDSGASGYAGVSAQPTGDFRTSDLQSPSSGSAGHFGIFGSLTNSLKTACCWMRPVLTTEAGSPPDFGYALGNVTANLPFGDKGWGFYWDAKAGEMGYTLAWKDNQRRDFSAAFEPDTWYFVALTFDGTTLTYYVNGNVEDTWTATGGIEDGTATNFAGSDIMAIGKHSVVSGIAAVETYFTGWVDECMLWTKCLTAGELDSILDISSLGAPTSGQVLESNGSGGSQWTDPLQVLADGA